MSNFVRLLVLWQVACIAQARPPFVLPRLLESGGLSGAARCDGKPVSADRQPLGKCFTDAAVDPLRSFVAECANSSVDVAVFDGHACAGQPLASDKMPVGQCFKPTWARGMSIAISCEGKAMSMTTWSLAPAAPDSVVCDDRRAVAVGTLSVRSSADASQIDEVSFEVALPGGMRPFLGFTAPVGADGEVQASVPGLRPSTKYVVFVRAHRHGEQEGNPDAWSPLGAVNATCVSSGASLPSRISAVPEAASEASKVSTRWLEVYRYASGATLPDFLDQHNAGDLTAEFGMVGLGIHTMKRVPVTRYCVEILDVDLPNITTDSPDGEPVQSHFADYASCIQGACLCTQQVDRSVARLPAKQVLDMCSGSVPPPPPSNDACRCSEQSLAQSSHHVGRLPVPLPFVAEFSWNRVPIKVPADYPSPRRPSPQGFWYSFPYKGRCPPGAKVGNHGCTWQRSPVSHTVYSDELVVDRNVTFDAKSQRVSIDFEASLSNILEGERAFERLSVKVPPCGAQEGIDFGSSLEHAPLQVVV